MNFFRHAIKFLAATCIVVPVTFGWAQNSTSVPSAHVPVLLELFTSEGCSSCPPADTLLQELDRKQPVDGALLVVLSEHVDYWNRLGWRDPFSSAAMSQRQEEYGSKLGVPEIYTPQIVVDGSRQALGSNWPAVKNAIAASLRQPKLPVRLSANSEGARMQVHVSIEPSPALSSGDVYLVLATDHTQSQVSAGENSGHKLDHVAVAYSFRKLGKLKGGQTFSRDVDVTPDAKFGPSATRVIAYVQNSEKRVVGLAEVKE